MVGQCLEQLPRGDSPGFEPEYTLTRLYTRKYWDCQAVVVGLLLHSDDARPVVLSCQISTAFRGVRENPVSIELRTAVVHEEGGLCQGLITQQEYMAESRCKCPLVVCFINEPNLPPMQRKLVRGRSVHVGAAP